jgi:cytochrome c biogenesis protein CcmG/thiol:disulfide interchange protein DsbE
MTNSASPASPAVSSNVARARWRWAVLGAVIVALIAAGLALFRAGPSNIGRPAPDFRLPPVTGIKSVALSDYRGRPVVVNFWASWCDPCRKETPALVDAAARYRGEVAFVGVDILDGRLAARTFIDEFHATYPQAFEGSETSTVKRFGVTGVPETFFVDAEGVLVGHYIGALTAPVLRDVLEQFVHLSPGKVLGRLGHGDRVSVR